jgi:hypothetical protein
MIILRFNLFYVNKTVSNLEKPKKQKKMKFLIYRIIVPIGFSFRKLSSYFLCVRSFINNRFQKMGPIFYKFIYKLAFCFKVITLSLIFTAIFLLIFYFLFKFLEKYPLRMSFLDSHLFYVLSVTLFIGFLLVIKLIVMVHNYWNSSESNSRMNFIKKFFSIALYSGLYCACQNDDVCLKCVLEFDDPGGGPIIDYSKFYFDTQTASFKPKPVAENIVVPDSSDSSASDVKGLETIEEVEESKVNTSKVVPVEDEKSKHNISKPTEVPEITEVPKKDTVVVRELKERRESFSRTKEPLSFYDD